MRAVNIFGPIFLIAILLFYLYYNFVHLENQPAELTTTDVDFHKLSNLKKFEFHYTDYDSEKRIYEKLYTNLRMYDLADKFIREEKEYVEAKNVHATYPYSGRLDSLIVYEFKMYGNASFLIPPDSLSEVERYIMVREDELTWEWKWEPKLRWTKGMMKVETLYY